MYSSTDTAPWHHFDTIEYATRNYAKQIVIEDRQLIAEAIRALTDLGIEQASLGRVADIGAGPNLYPALLLAPFVKPQSQGGRIELLEYSLPNRRYLESVIAGHDSTMYPELAHIWDKFEAYMTDRNPLWQNSLEQVKLKAKVAKGDIYHLPHSRYDAASAFFVPESITTDLEECIRGIQNIISAVKPGGVVLMGHMLGSTGYKAGLDIVFPAVSLTTDDLFKIYNDSIDQLKVIKAPPSKQVREEGYTGMALVVGRRKEQ